MFCVFNVVFLLFRTTKTRSCSLGQHGIVVVRGIGQTPNSHFRLTFGVNSIDSHVKMSNVTALILVLPPKHHPVFWGSVEIRGHIICWISFYSSSQSNLILLLTKPTIQVSKNTFHDCPKPRHWEKYVYFMCSGYNKLRTIIYITMKQQFYTYCQFVRALKVSAKPSLPVLW